MPQIGPLEIVMILVVALVVFGPKKLPEVGKQAARGLRELRRFQTGLRGDLQHMLDEDDDRDDAETDVPTVTETPSASPESDAPPADTTQ